MSISAPPGQLSGKASSRYFCTCFARGTALRVGAPYVSSRDLVPPSIRYPEPRHALEPGRRLVWQNPPSESPPPRRCRSRAAALVVPTSGLGPVGSKVQASVCSVLCEHAAIYAFWPVVWSR